MLWHWDEANAKQVEHALALFLHRLYLGEAIDVVARRLCCGRLDLNGNFAEAEVPGSLLVATPCVEDLRPSFRVVSHRPQHHFECHQFAHDPDHLFLRQRSATEGHFDDGLDLCERGLCIPGFG